MRGRFWGVYVRLLGTESMYVAGGVPCHLVVQSRCEGLVLVRAKADIEYRCPMLILLDQGGLLSSIEDFVEVNVLVP